MQTGERVLKPPEVIVQGGEQVGGDVVVEAIHRAVHSEDERAGERARDCCKKTRCPERRMFWGENGAGTRERRL